MSKILHLQTELNKSCGITKTIRFIIKGTPSITHHIITTGGDDIQAFMKISKIYLSKDKSRYKVFNSLFNFFYIIHLIKKNRYDYVHAHHRTFDLMINIIKCFTKISTITSVQSYVKGKVKISYSSDIIIACSEFIKHHLIEYFKINAQKINIIHNFIIPSELCITRSKNEILSEFGLSEDETIWGYFGRIDFDEKQIDRLILVFKKISKFSNLKLLLVGSGKDFNKAKNMIGETKTIVLVNAKNDIYNYYQILDYFVLPSKIEPFGIVLLEAGLNKVPVVASRIGGITEIVNENSHGTLFNFNNFLELEEIIKTINLKQFYVQQMVQNFYKHILDNFTEKSIKKYEKIYNGDFNV